MRSYNFHQQQKYLIPINFKVYLETIYLNLEVCRSLTEEQQGPAPAGRGGYLREMVEVTARYLEECQDIFQREGMEVRPVSEEERARAREKVCPLVEEYCCPCMALMSISRCWTPSPPPRSREAEGVRMYDLLPP